MKLTPEDLERAKELRKLGLLYREIAERWRDDPEYRKAKLKRGAASKRYLRKVSLDYRKYKNDENKEYKKRRKLREKSVLNTQ